MAPQLSDEESIPDQVGDLAISRLKYSRAEYATLFECLGMEIAGPQLSECLM
jgi:hypothetical protein